MQHSGRKAAGHIVIAANKTETGRIIDDVAQENHRVTLCVKCIQLFPDRACIDGHDGNGAGSIGNGTVDQLQLMLGVKIPAGIELHADSKIADLLLRPEDARLNIREKVIGGPDVKDDGNFQLPVANGKALGNRIGLIIQLLCNLLYSLSNLGINPPPIMQGAVNRAGGYPRQLGNSLDGHGHNTLRLPIFLFRTNAGMEMRFRTRFVLLYTVSMWMSRKLRFFRK